MTVAVLLVVPVSIVIVCPALLTVAFGLNGPGTEWILGFVVYTSEELHHVVVVILDVLVATVGSLPECIYSVNRPVALGDEVGGCSRFFPTGTTIETHCSHTVFSLTTLGCYKNNTVGSASTVDGRSGSVLDNGDGFHVVGVYHVDVADSAVDKDEWATAVDRRLAADV